MCNQAIKEILAAGDVWPESKQMTQPSIAEALTSCTAYDRKSKHGWKLLM